MNKKYISALFLTLAIIALAAGAWFYHHSKITGPHAYAYKQLNSYKLHGAGAGRGISFSLPSSFSALVPPAVPKTTKSTNLSKKTIKIVRPSETNTQQFFRQVLGPKGQQVIAATASVKSTAFTKPLSANDINTLSGYLNNPGANLKNPLYQSFIGGLNDVVKQRLPLASVNMSKAKTFTNSTIKANAWKFDLDINASDPHAQHQKGELIYIIGNKAYYYFLLTAINYNWADNHSTWQQVNDSLRINQ